MAMRDGEATVKRLFIADHRIELRPENKRLKPIVISPDDDFSILGKVVTVCSEPTPPQKQRRRLRMATTYNPKTFTNIDSLAGIDTALLAQFFKRFRISFQLMAFALITALSTISKSSRFCLSQMLQSIRIMRRTHELMEALQLITELSDQNPWIP